MHEFLKEIYNDFCTKHDLPWNEDGSDYLSADDLLYGHMYAEIDSLTQYQQNWLGNYIKLWEQTNGGEDI
tara:strand:- start:638 stop:847 length:210 start_codon:yes stop_codon:yes gene_type:complete